MQEARPAALILLYRDAAVLLPHHSRAPRLKAAQAQLPFWAAFASYMSPLAAMAERVSTQLLNQRPQCPSQQAATEVAASCGASAALPGQVAVCGGGQLLLLLLHRLLQTRLPRPAPHLMEDTLMSSALRFTMSAP